MRRHVFHALLAGGAIAAAVVLGAGQAFAAGTITITGADTTITGTSSNSIFSDRTSGQDIRCMSSTIVVSLADATNAPLPYTTTQADGTPHSITSWTFTGCSSSFGTVTLTADVPDDIVFTATSVTPPQASGFVQSAATSGLLFHVTEQTCAFAATGQPGITWTNDNQLKFTGTGALHAVDIAAGCFGLIGSGDVLAFTATYTFGTSTVTVGQP